ncbi:hypothetical protein Tco_0856321 [Tanacetum coccineum]|uniref:Uncharacterized protein n=1 Tax=Tanacetum coccineum TaxID=301880 RepID=A0ABQ5B8Q3_9ASTR
MEPIHPTIADLSGTCANYQVDETRSTRLRYQSLTKNKGKTSFKVDPDTKPLQLQTFADVQAFLLSEDELDKESDEKEVLATREDIDEDPQVAEEVRTPSPNQDQPKPSHSTVKDLQAHALKQKEASATWAKSSTNMAWNLGSRMTAIEISQTALKSEVSSLRHDTSEIKSMMTKIYQSFKGQSSSAPSNSITLTLALINILANVEGENATNTTTKEPPSHTEGETKDQKWQFQYHQSNLLKSHQLKLNQSPQ